MNGYILDTNVFNRLVDGVITLPTLQPDARYFATHVQLDELAATRNQERRERLLGMFDSVDADSLPTASLVVGVSRIGLARLSDGVLFTKIRDELDRRNGGKPNNTQDALIAETAITAGLMLVTEDEDLLRVVAQLGGAATLIKGIQASGPLQGPGPDDRGA